MASKNSSHANSARFATTRWSVVVSAGNTCSPNSQQALESLCEIYWLPLYAYVRRRVPDINEAQDLTQAFFAELLEKNYVAAADEERGQFRAFLITAFKNFLSKQREKNNAQKRGGGRTPISMDFDSAESSVSLEPSTDLTAEQIYDQQWTIALLGRILQRLKQEFDETGKSKQFEVLKGFVIGDHAGTTYADAAMQLNMSEAATRKTASRMRSRYRELLQEEIAQTVSTRADVNDEIRSLFLTFE